MGWKLFEELPKRRGKKPSEVSMIFYTAVVVTELHPDIAFFWHFLHSSRIKSRNYPLSLKVSRKVLALLQ